MALRPLPQPNIAWINQTTGVPTQVFAQYMASLDAITRGLFGANIGTLTNAPNDAAAKAAGVAVGQLYRNASTVHIRVT